MATIRATFILEDRASTTMGRIASKAQALDQRLEALDGRLRSVDRASGDLANGWETKMNRMRKATNDFGVGSRHDLNELQKQLNLMKMRKNTIHVEADTTKAMTQIRALRLMAQRDANVNLGARGGGGGVGARSFGMGGLAGVLAARSARTTGIAGRAFGVAASGANAFGNALDRVGVNLGPISARLSTLPMLVGALAAPVVGAAATALSVLAGAIAAVGVAAIGAGGLLGGFVLGVGSVAVPVAIAIKRIKEKQKSIDKYKKALDRSNDSLSRTNRLNKKGDEVTQAYKNAIDRRNKALGEYNDALSKMSKPEAAAVENYNELVDAWDRVITRGRIGANAMWMMNGALVFARQQLPIVSKWMERFSDAGASLFRRATNRRNSTRFRSALRQATDEMPQRFEEMGMATGHGVTGMLGVLRAAEPLMKWMSQGILGFMRNFDKWANGRSGQKAMRSFFREMQPLIKSLVGLVGDFGEGLIDVARRDAGDILYFLEEMREIVRALPGFIDRWTDRFRNMWPAIESGAGAILGFFDSMYFVGKDVMWVLGGIKGILEGIGGVTGLGKIDLPDSKRFQGWLAVLAFGAMGTKAGRGLTIRGVAAAWGGIAKAMRGIANASRNINGKNIRAAATAFRVGDGAGVFKAFGGGRQMTSKAGAAARSMGGVADVALGVMDSMTPAIPVYVVNWSMMNTGGGVGGLMGAGRGVGSLLGRGAGKVGGSFLTRAALSAMFAKEALKYKAAPIAGAGAIVSVAALEAWMLNKLINDPNSAARHPSKTFNEGKGSQHHISNGAIVPTTNIDGQQQAWPGAPSVKDMGFDMADRKLRRMRNSALRFADALGISRGAGRRASRIINSGFDAVRKTFRGIEALTRRDMPGAMEKFRGAATSAASSINGIVSAIFAQLRSMAAAFGINVGSDKSSGGTGAPVGLLPGQSIGPGGLIVYDPMNTGKPGIAKQGDGVGERLMSAASGGMTAIPKMISGMKGGGLLGKVTRGALGKIWGGVKNKLLDFGTGGATSGKGLLPKASAMASLLSRLFGVQLTSGFRPGSITEFGNQSLHSLGRAIDLGGSAKQMQAVWNFLLGKPGIQELIFNGMASYNGGPPVPFTGGDKHTDHVHVGLGDGVGMSHTPVSHARSGAGGVQLHINGDINISTGEDYDAFLARLTTDLETALNSMGGESAGEMIS